jgi:hypothetical protein
MPLSRSDPLEQTATLACEHQLIKPRFHLWPQLDELRSKRPVPTHLACAASAKRNMDQVRTSAFTCPSEVHKTHGDFVSDVHLKLAPPLGACERNGRGLDFTC